MTRGGKGAGAGWDGQRGGAGVVLDGLGGVEALMAVPWIEVGGTRSRSGVPLAGSRVGERGWGDARLEVKAEEMIVLSGYGSRSTPQLARRILCKLNFSVNCRFSSTPNRLLDLPLEVNPRKA